MPETVKAAEDDASYRLLDEWLRIETENTDPGFRLPDRRAIVTWIENHAIGVLVLSQAAVGAAVIGALYFG